MSALFRVTVSVVFTCSSCSSKLCFSLNLIYLLCARLHKTTRRCVFSFVGEHKGALTPKSVTASHLPCPLIPSGFCAAGRAANIICTLCFSTISWGFVSVDKEAAPQGQHSYETSSWLSSTAARRRCISGVRLDCF